MLAVPSSDTLYEPFAAAVSAPDSVRFPWNATVAPSLVSVMATAAASTVDWNVTPPELVIVTVPMSVPTASATVTTPVVLSVRFDEVPKAVPDTASRLMALPIPVPTVSVTLSASVTSPRSIRPVAAPPTAALAVTDTPVFASPSVIVLAADVAATVPAIDTELGAVAVTPAVNVSVSPASLPKVSAPVFENVVAVSIVPPPSSDTP